MPRVAAAQVEEGLSIELLLDTVKQETSRVSY